MSKFAEYDTYLNKDRKYSLLPFKFENLEEEEVVITNMVGEYVVIKRNKLDDLVTHS